MLGGIPLAFVYSVGVRQTAPDRWLVWPVVLLSGAALVGFGLLLAGAILTK